MGIVVSSWGSAQRPANAIPENKRRDCHTDKIDEYIFGEGDAKSANLIDDKVTDPQPDRPAQHGQRDTGQRAADRFHQVSGGDEAQRKCQNGAGSGRQQSHEDRFNDLVPGIFCILGKARRADIFADGHTDELRLVTEAVGQYE